MYNEFTIKRALVTDGTAEFTAWEQAFIRLVDRLGNPFLYKGLSCLFYYCSERKFFMKKAAVIMGSDSDLPVVEKAITCLKRLGIPFEVHVFSAHRTPEKAKEFAESAYENGFGAIIAAAGKAAHLAGAIAANTCVPVIGIPVKASVLDGLDALLSTVQMPSGIPVATVAIDGAENAALLAAQIIAQSDAQLYKALTAEREANKAKILSKDEEISNKYREEK